jgi:DMSO/TMAO reductase YedYZ molybdopterin-dependent catalytic subunit
LPPGQRTREDFPRFGLWPMASRFPRVLDHTRVELLGDVVRSPGLVETIDAAPRIEQVSDVHCVTTWSHRHARWSGVRFAEWYAAQVVPTLDPSRPPRTVVIRAQDGARTTMLLDDLLASDVLLADRLNGAPLTIAHGAPLRLVCPQHYAYKSAKHVSRIEFWHAAPRVRTVGFRFMDHPRARVAHEERGRWFPGTLLRVVYRPLIPITVAVFAKALRRAGLG